MKNLAFLLFITLALTTVSCKGKFYEKHHELPGKTWNKDNVMKYEAVVSKPNTKYDLSAAFSYTINIPHNTIDFKITIISPSGEKTTKTHSITIKDDKGLHLGDVAGDFGEIERDIETEYQFEEKGNYQFELSQNLTPQEVGGLLKVGLLIEKSAK